MKKLFFSFLISTFLMGAGDFAHAEATASKVAVAESLPLSKKMSDSKKIDQIIIKKLREEKIEPNKRSSDQIFVRRIYLDIVGRIPTKNETLKFLRSDAPDKRSLLIDELLDSEGFVSHSYHFWADLLRARTNINGNSQSRETGFAYERWIKEAVRANMPYDEMVTELVTSSGHSWDNGAVGYYIRDYGMPLDNLAVTSQVFLGTQIVCAQCHDHPFDKWKQMDYYHLAAFTYGMVTSNSSENRDKANALMAKNRKKYNNARQKTVRSAMTEVLKPLRFNTVNETKRSLRLPHDYQYDDAKPKDIVKPAAIMGPEARTSPAQPTIETFGEWLTSEQNPRFTKVIANRMWKRAFGVGVMEPVDDIREHSQPSNPELMNFLEEKMRDYGYDLKHFLRVIYNTQAYQREVVREEVTPGLPFHFPGPILRRMSAEQIWDSVVSMVRSDVDQPNQVREAAIDLAILKVKLVAEAVYDQTPNQFLKNSLEVARLQKELSGEIEAAQEALAGARETDDTEATQAAVQRVREIRRQLADGVEKIVFRKGLSEKVELLAMNEKGSAEADTFLNEIAAVLSENGDGEMEQGLDRFANHKRGLINQIATTMMEEDMADLNRLRTREQIAQSKEWKVKTAKEREIYKNFVSVSKAMVRASEIDSPAPGNHFLRAFGQSDRELVDNASDQASITQALNLLNGPTRFAIGNRYSVLSRSVLGKKFTERLDTIFLTMLSRRPTAEEKSIFVEAFRNNPETGKLHGIIWTMLNTRQFLFIQ